MSNPAAPKARNLALVVVVRTTACLALLAGGAGIYAALVATKPTAASNPKADDLRTVAVVETIQAPVGRRFRAYGSARPLESADVPARVGATVAKLGSAYHPGGTVKKGELLLVLDETDFERQLEMAKQAIDALDAQLAMLKVDEASSAQALKLAEEDARLARNDVERAEQAARDGAAKEREVDRVRQAAILAERARIAAQEACSKVPARRAALEADRARQEASRKLAADSLARCRIESPLDGILQVADKEVGEMVQPGARVARVVSPARLEVPILLPASARPFVRVGDPVELRAERDHTSPVRSVIARIAPEDDPATRTFAVYAELADAASISPGTFVEAQIECPSKDARTVVPRRAVSEGRAMQVVDGRVKVTPVEVEFGLTGLQPETGLPDSEWVVLRDPLPANALLVLDASRRIPDGTAIAPERPAPLAQRSAPEVGR